MGNWFSCFHSKKSKHSSDTQSADSSDADGETRTRIQPPHHTNWPKSGEIQANHSLTRVELRKHDVAGGNSGTAGTNSLRRSLNQTNGITAHDSNAISAKDTVSDNSVNALFERYKDDHEDAILMDGIERLCKDLNYKPDEFAILVLAWRLDASQMCRFTRSEFIQGLHALNADTLESIPVRLEQLIEKLKVNSEMFKNLYRFTFRFGLEPDNRIVLLDMAIILWRLVFTVHKPDILDRWLDYLEFNTTIRGIPKDTWNMFLNFAETCDITAYDDTEAWPSLFDDFVEYENDRLNQNVKSGDSSDAKKNAQRSADSQTLPQHL